MTAASLPRWMVASGALDPDVFDDEEHQPYDRAQLPHRCPGVLCCPHCHSVRVAQSHRGHKPAALLGAVAGGISGGFKTLQGLREHFPGLTNFRVGWLGLVAATLIGMLTGASAGCAVGAALGQSLDTHVLHTHLCLECGKGFTA
ncbi:MAG: hypothetical protein E6Q29_14460 [Alicycliphilus sp.]|jgi:hypothetical protein|nr:MAG: hypothetical protein E6Q29_14460 [Alicycliphilus sp.]